MKKQFWVCLVHTKNYGAHSTVSSDCYTSLFTAQKALENRLGYSGEWVDEFRYKVGHNYLYELKSVTLED
jgi:hypothetical protein